MFDPVVIRENVEDADMESDARHCATKFHEERRLAQAAPFPEAAEIHLQMAMLYKAQFKLLKSKAREGSSLN